MFQEKAVMFMYCVSPVHAGTGTAIGTIDSPIQRERHTYHPTIAGSGIKGALREYLEGVARSQKEESASVQLKDRILSVFGPEPASSNDYAGAVSFSDAQVVLFPVRSLKKSFVYVTCPTALARLQRILHIAGLDAAAKWSIAEPGELQYVPVGTIKDDRMILESFEFTKAKNLSALDVADDISKNAIPEGETYLEFFRTKIKSDTVMISDSDFTHFVRHSTLVEPHVRISDESGTAEEGGLFYVENLPPETLLVSLMMASAERRKGGSALSASAVIRFVKDNINGRLVQIGGDSTTGRGQIFLSIAGKGGKNAEDSNA